MRQRGVGPGVLQKKGYELNSTQLKVVKGADDKQDLGTLEEMVSEKNGETVRAPPLAAQTTMHQYLQCRYM